MNTLYSHAIRVLACQSCGAPIDAAIAGGQVQCSYCSATNVVTRRDESADRSRAAEALGATISESERYAQLRQQDQGPENLPESLQPWLLESTLNPGFVPQAQLDWQVCRQQLAAGSGAFSVAERFFWLTVLTVDYLEPRRQRATLETAAELLTDTRHRHVIRCMLARRAAQLGDEIATRTWLQSCNPRSTDLIMDTAYRYASATLAAAQNDPARIFEWVGHRAGDVPLADRQQFSCELLRAHALELSGQVEAAAQELRTWISRFGIQAVEGAIRNHTPLSLCPRSMAHAAQANDIASGEAQLTQIQAERAKLKVGAMAWLGPLSRLPFFALMLMVPVSAIRCTADADVLMGVYGYALCPATCHECHGPTRTVTVWTQTGPGESSSDGAWYYCQSPQLPLGDMSSDELEARSRNLGGVQLSGWAANGATYLILLMLSFPLMLIRGLQGHLQDKKQLEPLNDQLAQIARRLGRAPPEPDKSTFFRRLPAAIGLVTVFAGVALLMIAGGVFL